MKAGRIRSAIPRGYANENIFRIGLRVFHENIKVTILRENSSIYQLVFLILARSFAIFGNQLLVREFSVRILVQIFQIRTGRRGVEVVVIFDVLAMIAFAIGEAEEALFEDRVFLVPHGECETNVLVTIAETRNAVFTPTVRPGSRMVVRQIIPSVSISAVVFADGTPLPLRKVGSPALPMDFSLGAGFEALRFGCYRWHWIRSRLYIVLGILWISEKLIFSRMQPLRAALNPFDFQASPSR